MSRRLASQTKKAYVTKTKLKLIASAQKFREDFKDIDSTKYAESMDPTRTDYQIRAEYPTPISLRYQLAAMNGTYGFHPSSKKKYFSAAHFDLMRNVFPLRVSFRKGNYDESARREMAKKELGHWLEYFNRQKEQAMKQDEYWIQSGSIKLLKEAFDRQRNRDTMCVSASDIIDAHGMFSKTFQFKVPIHPKNLSQMIHPHQGYMVSMPDRSYSWDEMMAMYEMQMVASYQKAKGRDLHGDELSALAFWLVVDHEKEGSISQKAMSQLMHGLRFPNLHTWSEMRNEFAFTIEKGEFAKGQSPVFRFDLMRQIFLDRGL